MPHEVYANGNEIAGKAGANKSIARFPDVCMSPPGPPAGPIPVPYPDTSLSSDLKEGTTTVKLGGSPAALAQQSYYQPSALGNEAATRAWGMNVVTHQITGKTYFQAWSMDVQMEGKNVCRHMDITTSNHASSGTTTSPNVTTEAETVALIKAGKCPCCQGPLHDNQKDDTGRPLTRKNQDDYYQGKRDAVAAKSAGYPEWAKKNPARVDVPMTLKFGAGKVGLFPEVELPPGELAKEELRRADSVLSDLKAAEAANPDCPNLHNPKDVGCGTHFEVPNTKRVKQGQTKAKTPGQLAREEYEKSGAADDARRLARAKYPGKDIPDDDTVNHKTPLDAGGCPTSQNNLIPSGALDARCKHLDDLQTVLQGRQ